MDIEIIKWIVRIDESKQDHKAKLVGYDKDNTEYELWYYDNHGDRIPHPDIVATKTT